MTNENFWQRPTIINSEDPPFPESRLISNRPSDLMSGSPMFSSSPHNVEKRLRALEAAVFGQGNDSTLEGIADHHLKQFTPSTQWQKQHPVCGNYKADFALPEIRLAVEIDGHPYHSTVEQIEKDKIRDRDFLMAGWHTMRFSSTELNRTGFECLSQVADCLKTMGMEP